VTPRSSRTSSRRRLYSALTGDAEFAGPENDGQRNFKGWKLQDWKMTDKSAGVENAGLENDRQKCRAGKCRTGK